MATPSSNQQSSQLKKLLLLGGGLIVIVMVALPSGSPTSTSASGTGSKTNYSSGPGKLNAKKVDPYHTKADDEANKNPFARIDASLKNGFVPGIGKGDGKLSSSDLPSSWTDGGTWTYTGNMVVDGTPNALLENSLSGDGVFLRPGQHWKSCRLIAVKDDSIEVEGPNGLRKTVFFNDKSLSTVNPSTTLPPATIQGNIPNNTNPQFGQPNGNPRRQRGQQANADAMVGEIGSSDNLVSSIDGQDQINNSNYNRNNRKIKRNQ